MANEHECIKEHEWGTLETTLKFTNDALTRIEKRIGCHIDEGERQGGYRDRIIALEHQLKSIWWICIVFSTIGGLIGKLTPDLINFVIKTAFAGQ